jgi:hypothetical protein
MKTTLRWTLAFLLALLSGACSSRDQSASRPSATPDVVLVTARGLTLDAPDQIPAGWVTFRFRNESSMVHFGVLERMPAGIGIDEQQKQVAPVFQAGMNLLSEGHPGAAQAEFGKLPAWFAKVVFLGGPGLTSPGRTSETTVKLTPGTYLMECYVKTAGVFHSYNPDSGAYGMVHQFRVTAPPSGAPEPSATLRITLSTEHGIQVHGDPVPGVQTVAVHFDDQELHGNFVGHDLHLVKLGDGVDPAAVAAWMDWTQPHGLEVPAPATFLGGVQEMPAGDTGYLTVDLTPGRYAWISEVPHPDRSGMLRTFTVPVQPL